MTRYPFAYVTAAVCFLTLDLIWLGVVAGGFYRAELGDLMLREPNLTAAAFFYALYLVGVMIFGVAPGLAAGSWIKALWSGALFGFFAYATYDLTNLATLRGWSVRVALLDMAWGAFVTGVCSVAGYFGATLWARRRTARNSR